MKIVESVTPIDQRYIQYKNIGKAYDLSRMQVYRLIQRMKRTAKYKKSFVDISPKCKLVKLDDFDDFFKSTHNQYLTKEV